MLLQRISLSDLQINIFMSQWLKQRAKTKSALRISPASLPVDVGRMTRTPSLFEPVPTLPVPTLVLIDYLNELCKLSISCIILTKSASAAAADAAERICWSHTTTPQKRKSAIDSAKCIFILIKRNQIRSRNTSLILYWNWPAVQCTLSSRCAAFSSARFSPVLPPLRSIPAEFSDLCF